jgi:hypothetical protein
MTDWQGKKIYQMVGAVFAGLLLPFCFQDAEGFAGEVKANFFIDDTKSFNGIL